MPDDFRRILTSNYCARLEGTIPQRQQGPSDNTVRTPLAKATLGNMYVCVFRRHHLVPRAHLITGAHHVPGQSLDTNQCT